MSTCFPQFESLHIHDSFLRYWIQTFQGLTFRGQLRSNIFILFESPYMTSYLTSIDTFSLSISSEVNFFYTIRKPVYDFLFDFYGHHLSIKENFESGSCKEVVDWIEGISIEVFFNEDRFEGGLNKDKLKAYQGKFQSIHRLSKGLSMFFSRNV